jgi:hypothetical protein
VRSKALKDHTSKMEKHKKSFGKNNICRKLDEENSTCAQLSYMKRRREKC